MAQTISAKIQDMEGKWLFIAPVGNLDLTKDVQNEFKIKRVTFITGAKFRRIFKRLKIDPSRLTNNREIKKVLKPECTLAFLHQSGKPSKIKPQCFQMIRDELNILAASQLYFRKRRSSCKLGLIGEYKRGVNEHVFLDTKTKAGLIGWSVTDNLVSLTLDKQWKDCHKGSFFGRFIKILQGKVTIKTSWAADITRSVCLVGKSFNSDDIGSAFLWNMVALEMLLARQGDKYAEVIPKRIEALLGWIGYWDTAKFAERIDDIYKLRCKIVHDGRLDLVTPKDLLFTDDLMINVLFNLVRHPKVFQSKDDLINFADLVSAEHLLGMKSRIRPKTLRFTRRNYSQKDFDI